MQFLMFSLETRRRLMFCLSNGSEYQIILILLSSEHLKTLFDIDPKDSPDANVFVAAKTLFRVSQLSVIVHRGLYSCKADPGFQPCAH